MPWNEFIIKSQGYSRQAERKETEIRILAYYSYIGPSLSLKTIPKFETFLKKKGLPKMTEEISKGLKKLSELQDQFKSKQAELR